VIISVINAINQAIMPGIAQMGTVEAEEVVVVVAVAAEVLGDEVDLVQVSDFFFWLQLTFLKIHFAGHNIGWIHEVERTMLMRQFHFAR
jgi:hypothetical protein